jgi:DHA1 family bicyclomycin/chloramphenicol resistance-like MFS transporter
MLLGAISIALISVVFDGTPLMLTAAVALCSLLAAGLSLLTLRVAPQQVAA